MPALAMYEEYRTGVAREDSQIVSPTAQDVIAAIKRLNGKQRTLVVLAFAEEISMAIGGGDEGRCVVNVAVGVDREFYNLVDLTRPKDLKVDIVVGGQEGQYQGTACVTREQAIKAAVYFIKGGRLAEELSWQKQPD